MENRSLALACVSGLLLLPTLGPTHIKELGSPPADLRRLHPHQGDLESAQREALDRNAPLLIHIVLEGEERNDVYRDEVLTDKELIKLSEGYVVLVGNNGEHPQIVIKEKVDGVNKKRNACSKYPMLNNCEEHRKIWNPIYHEYQDEDGDLGCPQTILLSPAGEIDWRHNVREVPAISQVTGAIKESRKKHGKSLTLDELRVVKGNAAAMKNALQAEDWPRAWLKSSATLEIIDVGKWAELAKAAQTDALAKMRAQLAALEARFLPGQVAAAWRELSLLAEEAKETPLARDAASLKKKVERDKDLKDELKTIKAELAAEALWDEAEALLRRGDEKKAMKLFKKLLGKKYGGTEIQKRVGERFPDL